MEYTTCCKYGYLLKDIASSGKDPEWLLKKTHQDVAAAAIPYFLKHHLIEEHQGDPAPQRFAITREGQALLATFKDHLPKAGSFNGNTIFNTSSPKVSEQDLVDSFPH